MIARQGRSPAVLWVARGGVEPPTFRFSVGRSYQLSYLASCSAHATTTQDAEMTDAARGAPRAASTPAVLTGLEPATSALTGRRALQLLHRTWSGAIMP